MRTNTETLFYIRTQNGKTFYVETLDEAIAEFSSNEGYRLSIEAGAKSLVIRRDPNPMVLEADDFLEQMTYGALVTVKKSAV